MTTSASLGVPDSRALICSKRTSFLLICKNSCVSQYHRPKRKASEARTAAKSIDVTNTFALYMIDGLDSEAILAMNRSGEQFI